MKFSATQLLAISFATYAAADFHILTGVQHVGVVNGIIEDFSVACPSNYYNCKCIMNKDRAGLIETGTTPVSGITKTGSKYFQVGPMCGVGLTNFYLQSDGTWKFFLDGGDGTLQGQCYPGDNSNKSCSGLSASADASNILVCYSYICN